MTRRASGVVFGSLAFIDAHIIPWYPTPSRQELPQASGSNDALSRRAPLSARASDSGDRLDRFVAYYLNRFDAKGRISIPAPFRGVLARDGFDGLYVLPSLDAPALDCGGNALLGRIDALLNAMPPYSQAHDLFATALFGASEILRPDPEGRIALSAASRAHLNVDGEAIFVGQGYKFQIWRPDRFAEHLGAARRSLREMRLDPTPAAEVPA
jgi:MraZ protein